MGSDKEDILIILLIVNTVLLLIFLYNLFKTKSQIDKFASESFKLMVTRLQEIVQFEPIQQ